MIIDIIALRTKLAHEIAMTNDLELLKKVYSITGLAKKKESTYELSEEETSMVEEYLDQIYNGEWVSAEVADKEIEEWLNK